MKYCYGTTDPEILYYALRSKASVFVELTTVQENVVGVLFKPINISTIPM